MEDDPLSGAGLAPSRSACPVAVRSVTLSVPDLARSEAFFSRGLGLERSDAALRAPEHEALWGLAGARTQRQRVHRRRASSSSSSSISIRSGGRARPATGSRIKASSTSPSARGAGAITASSTAAHARPGRGRTAGRFTCLAPASSTSTTRSSSRSSCCGCPERRTSAGASRRDQPRKRPRADTHAIERTVRIAAPVETTWDVIANHENMAEWIGLGSVRRTVDGAPDRDGRGSERLLKLPGASITEQVVAYEPPTSYRYRVTKGSPFVCHQGEIRLRADRRSDRAHLEDPLPAEAAREPAARWRSCSPGCSGACCARASSRIGLGARGPATTNDRTVCDGFVWCQRQGGGALRWNRRR